MTQLLQIIDAEIEKLDPHDAPGFIYWGKFREMVLEAMKADRVQQLEERVEKIESFLVL